MRHSSNTAKGAVILLIPKDTPGQNCFSSRNHRLHLWTCFCFIDLFLCFLLHLLNSSFTTAVGHLICPRVFVGVETGMCVQSVQGCHQPGQLCFGIVLIGVLLPSSVRLPLEGDHMVKAFDGF
jgi:hypothetical protein